MKKTTLTMALAAIAAVAGAQALQMNAFENVGVGVEAGLMGAGIEVSVPVVTNRLVLVAGVNFPTINVTKDITLKTGNWNKKIDELNAKVDKLNGKYGYDKYNHVYYLNEELVGTADAKVKLTSFKTLLEYYPSSNSSFHLVAGFMIGKDKFVDVHGAPDKDTQEAYFSALTLNDAIKDDPKTDKEDIQGIKDIDDVLHFSIDNKTYRVKRDCTLDAAVKINRVRPYIGFGFGRAIPNNRVGFQFEMGAWYHGTPKVVSPNELSDYDPKARSIEGIGEALCKVEFYPQMTFRLTGRIL